MTTFSTQHSPETAVNRIPASQTPVELEAGRTAHAQPLEHARDPFAGTFVPRHLGPDQHEIDAMLAELGFGTLDELTDASIPEQIRSDRPLAIDPPCGEQQALREMREIASKNRVFRSYIGMGYHDTVTPPVLLRNILENPGWYTQYTPYQAEIAQGRLEALLAFQTMVSDLTGLPLANASMLDEATAAAEAMTMCHAIAGESRMVFFVAEDCHPQTIAVVQSRAESQGFELVIGKPEAASFADVRERLCGALVQYPTTDGRVEQYESFFSAVHEAGGVTVVAADLLALTLIKAPAEFGADIAIGSTQRFGVPLGAGGPHAGYLATKDEHARKMPGRIVGVSRDAHGDPAFRLAIQTREQHIKRERATSNICTAQVLLAIIAAMYAAYHGPQGLKRIAQRVHRHTRMVAEGLRRLGFGVDSGAFFDTIRVRVGGDHLQAIIDRAARRKINFRSFADGSLGIALDETVLLDDVRDILACFTADRALPAEIESLSHDADSPLADASLRRTSDYLTHPMFNQYHSETEMLRYLAKLESRDLSLRHSMIPLGSCTMKLNATAEMIPVTWPELGRIHPFAPAEQQRGYAELYAQLERWLCEITGFTACSLQPNAGSQGEYAGLLVIRAYHKHHGNPKRNVCLIPTSAHGTNPASAVIAGFDVVAVRCDENGNIDLNDLRAKAEQHLDRLGALMVTYPSTHGVFERTIREVCAIVHEHGGLVYLDGANMNAQVGLCRPGDPRNVGADVCHLNLHKTFCIPHGGGGPGMGPICVNDKLKPFLPGHPVLDPASAGEHAINAISAAPYGSPSILPISWMYIRMMGGTGLTRATQVAVMNANYMAKRLEKHYDVVYRGLNGRVAHEFIIDCRAFQRSANVRIDDIAKRLIDYGFHAPTMSWPVPGTLMIEPTESESKAELDRFCDAMIAIRAEIAEIERGEMSRDDNVLTNAPHTIAAVSADDWPHGYSREKAAYPVEWLRDHKFWPFVGRVDNPYGDRNLVCTCTAMEAMVIEG